eukprot:IDg756t1
MGRTPLSSLRSAVSGAPANQGASAGGPFPFAKSLRPAASASCNPCLRSAPGACRSSRRWVGEKPDPPAADARGNRLAALRTSPFEKEVGCGRGGSVGSGENVWAPSVTGPGWPWRMRPPVPVCALEGGCLTVSVASVAAS